MSEPVTISKKLVLITGCSSGFGKELVGAFLSQGWSVIATMRRASERRELFSEEMKAHGSRLTLLDLDVTSSEDRKKAAQEIRSRFDGSLDCLINNAGTGLFGALEDYSEEQLRQLFEVNFFGAAFMMREMLPFLRQAQGKIINVSSVVGFFGTPFSSAYSSSKFALEGLSEAMVAELQSAGVQICLIEPGSFRTSFRENARWGERSFDQASPYRKLSEEIRTYREKSLEKSGDPGKVVEAIVRVAQSSGRIRLRVRSGKDSQAVYLAKRLLPASWFNRIAEKAFFRVVRKESR